MVGMIASYVMLIPSRPDEGQQVAHGPVEIGGDLDARIEPRIGDVCAACWRRSSMRERGRDASI
jgi:hypothetical protein